eukprot:symbB.v1.2.038848.t2/scaffold6186.1/size20243/1
MTFLEFDATYISTVLLFLTAVTLVGLWGALHAKAFLDARPTKLSRQTFTVVDTEAPASPTSGDISNGFIEMDFWSQCMAVEKNADISLEIKYEEPKELKIQKIEEKNADISLEIKYEEPKELKIQKIEAPLPPPPFLLDGQMHLQILRRDRRSRRARLASINEETAVDTPKWMAYLGSYMANEVLPRVPTGQEHTWETVCDTMTALAKWLRSDDAEHLSKAFRPCFGFSCERCGIAAPWWKLLVAHGKTRNTDGSFVSLLRAHAAVGCVLLSSHPNAEDFRCSAVRTPLWVAYCVCCFRMRKNFVSLHHFVALRCACRCGLRIAVSHPNAGECRCSASRTPLWAARCLVASVCLQGMLSR